ncbi:Inner membrane protein YdcO [compost metagenome]
MRDEAHREAALITFLVTLSGVTLAGIGSAFWGVVAGAVALAVQQVGRAQVQVPVEKAPAGKDIAASGNMPPETPSTAAAPGAGKNA